MVIFIFNVSYSEPQFCQTTASLREKSLLYPRRIRWYSSRGYTQHDAQRDIIFLPSQQVLAAKFLH